METNYTIYDLILGNRPAYAWSDPRFVMSVAGSKHLNIPRAAGEVKMDGNAAGFPGTPAEQVSSKRLVSGTDGTGFEASFKLCWDDNNLYLLADITDPTPMMNTQTGDGLWAADGGIHPTAPGGAKRRSANSSCRVDGSAAPVDWFVDVLEPFPPEHPFRGA